MDEKQAKPSRALSRAFSVFVFLSAMVIVGAVMTDLTHVDMVLVAFLLAIFCCMLAAKATYDTTILEERLAAPKKSTHETFILPSRELYTELYKNSPVPYLLIDKKGFIRSGNLAARRLLGVAQGKIEGINIFSRLSCDESEHLEMLIEKYQSGIAISDENVRLTRANNTEAWALMSLFQFAGEGESLGMLTLVDITKQKQIENAKSEFVSLASHQLRTPIAGIKWSAELLQMDNPDSLTDRQRKYIDRLLASTNRMALLVDDFLRVSRFELGTFQREYHTIDIQHFLNDIILEQTQRIEQRRLEVKTFFDESVTTIVTDQNLLRMIIGNLLSNAVKYSFEGGTIHIGYAQKDDSIVFSVGDNGMGIPLADQDRVFSKLFRAANAVRSVPDGTGLGLYIVKEAVDVLQGNITFTSAENMNTTFEVALPLELPAS